jgi:hypothetical protein
VRTHDAAYIRFHSGYQFEVLAAADARAALTAQYSSANPYLYSMRTSLGKCADRIPPYEGEWEPLP